MKKISRNGFLLAVFLLFILLIGNSHTASALGGLSATNLSSAETYTEDTALNLIDIVVTDTDSANVTATLTLSSPSVGSFSTATSGTVTSTYNAGTGVWTASGATGSVNTLLSGVTFTPTSNGNSNFTIATNINDGINSALTGSKAMTGTPVNDAPVLDASRTPTLMSVNQNAGVPVGAVGTLVLNLVDFAPPFGGVDNVSDIDAGAVTGVAITATDTTHATYYYSIDNGSTWNILGAVSSSSSRLLAANSTNRIYVQPSSGFSGTIPNAITFRAWDQTSGSDGGTASTVSAGGTTAFSASTDNALITVNAVSTPFITTWTTTSDNQQITIPINNAYTSYNYDVDWGDGNTETGDTASADHTYATAGPYTVTITGTFPAIQFNNAADAPLLTDINQWGTNPWLSMSSAFYGCTGLTTLSATDTPNLSGVMDMSSMFRDAVNFNSDISGWNTSNVTGMGGMFWGATVFNQDIGSWDVSNVTNMDLMFDFDRNFNQDLSSWNVGNVTSMYSMFNTADSFNNGDSGNNSSHPLSWGSHTSKVTSVQSMFYYNHIFNQDISSWDVSSLTTTGSMFQSDESFNNGGHPLSWGTNTAQITTMSAMFFDDTAFNQDISSWDVRNVTDMSGMFVDDTLSFVNYDALLVAWSLEPVQPSVPFDAGNSTYCSPAAIAARAVLAGSPNNWSITDGGQACGFTTTWNTANPGIDGNNQITIPTFSGDTYNYDVDWGDGNKSTGETGNAQHTYTTPGIYTVRIAGTFPRIYFDDGGSSDAEKILSVEHWGPNHWDSMGAAFAGCINLVINATDAPDLSGVTDAGYMFLNATSLNQDLSSWDTSTITDMYGMFQSTTSFNQSLDAWNTSNVNNMGYMFENDPAFNQPLSSWNTSQVTNMDSMFYGDALFNQDISSWDVGNVTSMSYMFKDASAFNQPLNSWNVSNVTSMAGMFVNTDVFNQPLNLWNVGNVTDMNSMFKNNQVFDQDISSWDVSHVTGLTNFFQIGQGGFSTTNYDALLQAWSQEPLQSSVTFFVGRSKYCPSAAAARASIISTYSWAIMDGGLSSCITTHSLTYSAGPNGTLTGTASQTVNDGSNGTAVTAIPNSGYDFVNWTGTITSTDNPLTNTIVTQDMTETANFALAPAPVIVPFASGGGGGGGGPVGPLVSTPLPQSTQTSKGTFVFTKNLRYRMDDSDVSALQEFLDTHGFPVATTGWGSINQLATSFGGKTLSALKRYQASVHLPATGYFGPMTREVVNKVLSGK